MFARNLNDVVFRQQPVVYVQTRGQSATMDAQAIRNRIVRKMLRKNVVGTHKMRVDTIVGFSLPTDERGRGRTLLQEMAADPGCPVEAYGGGHRENVRLTSIEAAVRYLNSNGGDVPFGFR